MAIYTIKRDGKPVGICEAAENMGPLAWFHSNTNQSLDWMTTHEGYSVDEGEPDCSDVAELLEGIAGRLGVTATFQFVPFSRSRNAGPDSTDGKPWESLNWRVTLARHGRDFMTTDYGQGVAHAPAYKSKRFDNRLAKQRAIAIEIETGKIAGTWFNQGEPRATARNIDPPALGDVLHSLALDSSVLDEGGFADWASSLGYDSDSIKAKAIYDLCLSIALNLQATIGGEALRELRLAAQFN